MAKVNKTTKKKMVGKAAAKAAKQIVVQENNKLKAGLKSLKKDQKAVNEKALVKRGKSQPTGELVDRDSMMAIVGTVTTTDLKKALEIQTEQRGLIEDFIKQHLREDRDYGKIHVVKNCPDENRKRGSCNKEYHYSKAILFKPGQEKIFSLFSITDELVKDTDAYDMLPDVKGLVAYKCIMYQKGKRIGEGRGAATLMSERSDPNSTIKKAEKRARMDACLSLGFSEYFTQDLDDPEYASQREMMNSKAAAEAERRDKDEFGLMPRDPDSPIDNLERATLHKILIKAGFTDPDEILELLKSNGIPDPRAMTSGQAREMMGKVSHSLFSLPKRPAKAPNEEIKPEVPPEPELVVDDDLKNEIMNRANQIGLNAAGGIWLMQRIAGKPFAKWNKLTDEEWRKAYEVVEAILDGNINVEDRHLAGVIADDDSESTDPVSEVFPGSQSLPLGDKVKNNG